ncbi:hypothetical protein Ndes2437A_g08178 [Nannochloris sp. 'desiccata']
MCEAVVTLSREVSKQDEPNVEDICWICHEGHSDGMPLAKPCRCKCMQAHRPCLARWQLQQAGRTEERFCRFCKTELPDWREAHSQLPKASPIMTVVHNGVTHQVTVEPESPGTATAGHEITLEGWEAFDAAVHCAAISAGQRMKMQNDQQPKPGAATTERKTSGGMLRRLFSRTNPQQGL